MSPLASEAGRLVKTTRELRSRGTVRRASLRSHRQRTSTGGASVRPLIASGSSRRTNRALSADPSQRVGSIPASASSTSSHRRSNWSQPSSSNAGMEVVCTTMASRCATALIALTFLAVAASPAAAAGCPPGATCGRLTVPLDHAGTTPGTLDLAYAKRPATGTRTGTLVFLTGGPGQAAIPFLNEFVDLVKPLTPSYHIVAIDQRGTGASDAIDCRPDECAQALGAR